MAFSRQLEERRQRREAARRDRALERRQETDRRQAEDERRREEAAAEGRALEAALEADRLRREALVLQARMIRLAERRDLAQRAEQRLHLIESILAARREAAEEVESKRLRRGQLLESLVAAKAGEERERRAATADRPKATAGRPDRPEAAADAGDGRDLPGRDAPAAADRAPEPKAEAPAEESAARVRAREEQRARAEREARTAERLESRRLEREAAAAEAARLEARRSEAREARLAERREAAEAVEAIRGEREAAQRQRLEQRQQHDAASQARRERTQSARALRSDLQRGEGRDDESLTARDRKPERDGTRLERPPRPDPSVQEPLTDRIPSGVLSGSLPWLTTQGNRVITIAGEPVILRGVSVVGMDGAPPDSARGYAAGAGISDALLDQATAWGANVVRVAINRRRVLAGTDQWTGWDYLRELDELVRRLAQSGAYTLLSLRRLDDTTIFGTRSDGQRVVPNEIAPQPDFDAIGMWRLVAERYADEPAVLFDLYTAPRTAASDDLTGYRTDWDLWTLWVQMTIADLRLVHPRALCLVAGLDEGTDLSALPIPGSAGDPIPNLVYAAHLTPRKSAPWPAIQALGRRHPVFVTEWGGSDADLTWGERTALALRAAGIGWTAAHWNAEPRLVSRVNDRLVPTRFGMVVQRAFALAASDSIAPRSPAAPAAAQAG